MTTTRPAVQPGPRTVAAPPRPSRVGGFAAAALLVLLGVLGLTLFASMGGPLRDDVAWLLYIADRWLDGQRPYVGLLETNPPTIIWISTLPAALARALGLPTLLVAPPVFAGLVLGCAWWAADILRRRGVLEDRLITFAVLGVVLLGLPAGDFGQREHLLVAAALPYLALRAGSFGAGRPARTGSVEGALAGALVGICCAMKPSYALAFGLVEGAVVLRGARPLYGAVLGAAATGVALAGAAFLLHPEYFSEAVPLVLAFYWVGDPGFVDVIRASAVLLSCLAAAWLLWLVRGRTGVADRGGVAWVLLVFAAGATLAYLLQGKGWFYQRVPAVVATALALLAMAAAAVQAAARPLRSGRAALAPKVVATVAAAALLALGFLSAVQFAQRIKVAIAPERTLEARLAGLIRAEGARSYVAFSRTLGLGFPVVNETGVVWASRFVSTWALYGEHLRTERAGPGTVAATAPVAGRWMVEDFLAVCPELVVVDDRDGLDYPRLLGAADPRFVPVWSAYQMVAAFDGLRAFRRPRPLGATAGCAAGPRAPAG
jgi:hypothetical protein